MVSPSLSLSSSATVFCRFQKLINPGFWRLVLYRSVQARKKCRMLLTALCHVILGLGFPLASHSRVMVEPFLTTNFPSEGWGITEGGTGIKEGKYLVKTVFHFKFKFAEFGHSSLKSSSSQVLSFHFQILIPFSFNALQLTPYARNLLVEDMGKSIFPMNEIIGGSFPQ